MCPRDLLLDTGLRREGRRGAEGSRTRAGSVTTVEVVVVVSSSSNVYNSGASHGPTTIFAQRTFLE